MPPADQAGGCAGKAYVANNYDGTVSVITTATGAVSAPIAVGNDPHGVAFTPDGKHAYVTQLGADTVSVITTKTGADVGPHHGRQRPGRGGVHSRRQVRVCDQRR